MRVEGCSEMTDTEILTAIEQFVHAWAPAPSKVHVYDSPAPSKVHMQHDAFISDLRRLLNDYAQAALKHGDLPEKRVPHQQTPGPVSYRQALSEITDTVSSLLREKGELWPPDARQNLISTLFIAAHKSKRIVFDFEHAQQENVLLLLAERLRNTVLENSSGSGSARPESGGDK
jgi:hypothetical protein